LGEVNFDDLGLFPIEGIEDEDGNGVGLGRMGERQLIGDRPQSLCPNCTGGVVSLLPLRIGGGKNFWNGCSGQDVVELIEQDLFPGTF
jgi:hypothetical protein